MTKRKTTRRALFSSAVSLLLCFAMLMGTTFAWFTDEAKTGVNTIQAGTLDIELLDTDGASLEGKSLEFVKADGAPDEESTLWEPGVTYYTQGFQIKNAGDLYLKFKIVVNGITDGSAKLLEALEFYLTTDLANYPTGAVPLGDFSGEYTLAPGMLWDGTTSPDAKGTENGEVVYLVGHMKEEAGNEYMGLFIDGVGITVYATQVEAEFDSFDNNYDANATYEPWAGDVASAEELASITDTENKTITISTPAQLAALAAHVNGTLPATYSAEETVPANLVGYTVLLAEDLNLNNQPWTPIGAGEAKFEGKFDGQGHTIYKLRVDAASKAGLFGNVFCGGDNKAVIENLNIDGAVINSSHHAGVIAGSLYGTITNCSVNNAVVTCTTELVNGSYDNGDKAGGIVGYAANAQITQNTVTNTTVVGYRDIGGVVGCITVDDWECVITDNTVVDVTLTLDGTNGYDSESGNAGAIVGSYRNSHKEIAAAANTVNSVTITKQQVVTTAEELMTAVEEGSTTAVIADGTKITLSDETITNAVTGAPAIVNNGELIISGGSIENGTSETKGAHTIKNTGTLIITGGTIGTDDTAGAAVYNDGGYVEINGGTFASKQEDSKGEGTSAYAFINYSGTMVINDATVTEPTHGLFGAYGGTITVNGGNYTLKDAEDKTNTACYITYTTGEGRVIINGGTFNIVNTRNGNYMYHWDGAKGYFKSDVTGGGYVTMNGGTYNFDVTGYAAAGYQVTKNEDGTWTVDTYKATNATELKEALEKGGVVIMTEDVATTDLLMNDGATLNGNGNTLNVSANPTSYDCAITTTGGTIENVTITGNSGNTRAIGAGSSGDTQTSQDLYIKNVTIDNVQYAINGHGNGTASVYVSDSTVYGWCSYANIANFSFTNCTLGTGNSYLGYMVVYGNTSFTDCTFVDFDMCADSSVAAGSTVTFTNCTNNGVKVTAENFKGLFMYPGDDTDFNKLQACTIIIDGVTVVW